MLRRWFEDMSTYTWLAAALFVLGSGFILADLQSPSLLQWTGTQVADVQSGGIAYYSFEGVDYTLDLPGTCARAVSHAEHGGSGSRESISGDVQQTAIQVDRGHGCRRSLCDIAAGAGLWLCSQIAAKAPEGHARPRQV